MVHPTPRGKAAAENPTGKDNGQVQLELQPPPPPPPAAPPVAMFVSPQDPPSTKPDAEPSVDLLADPQTEPLEEVEPDQPTDLPNPGPDTEPAAEPDGELDLIPLATPQMSPSAEVVVPATDDVLPAAGKGSKAIRVPSGDRVLAMSLGEVLTLAGQIVDAGAPLEKMTAERDEWKAAAKAAQRDLAALNRLLGRASEVFKKEKD
jgi:hypothetical protein